MEITITSRPLATEAEWLLAARMKRDRDYAGIVDGDAPWSEPEVHAIYQETWGHGEADYQLKRLREATEGGTWGELRGWFEGDTLVAFAGLRETNLLTDEGPSLLIVNHLYLFGGDPLRTTVAGDLARIADARGVTESEATIDPRDLPAFDAAGFGQKIAVVRRSAATAVMPTTAYVADGR